MQTAGRRFRPVGVIASYGWAFGDGSGYGANDEPRLRRGRDVLGRADRDRDTRVTVDRRPSQAKLLADLSPALTGAEAVIDAGATAPRTAIVLDIDNIAIQSYYQTKTATPQVLAPEQRAVAAGYAVLVATGRSADAGYTAAGPANAGYRISSLCFRDPAAPSIQASKTACRAAWDAQGYSIVANIGNHLSDLDGGNSGQTYLQPNFGFLD